MAITTTALLGTDSDVRLISIDGGSLHLVLPNGSLDLTFRTRGELAEALRSIGQSSEPAAPSLSTQSEHVMYSDGIYGI